MNEPVSVIVPHYNDLDRLDACLSLLLQQTFPRERVEIVVADNGSACGGAAVEARIAGRARLTICLEQGAGPARNAGVAAAHHKLLAFTDSDCLPEPGWLAAGMTALENPAEPCDLVGGRVTVAVREPGRRSGAEALEQVFSFNNRNYVLKHDFTVTANLFTRRDVFEAVGGFRTNVAEDIDWCWRAVAAGYRLAYAGDAVVAHPARVDWAELMRKSRRVESEAYALALERPGGRLRWLARACALPASIIVHAPLLVMSPALANPGERIRGLATLVRLRLWRFSNAFRLGLGRQTR